MKAVTQYNNIMFDCCIDHRTVGTRLSENTENWNLRDMVSEMQYTLNVYEDPSRMYWEEAHDESQPEDRSWYKEWYNRKMRMKRFIEKYKGEALTMECTEKHCSKYD